MDVIAEHRIVVDGVDDVFDEIARMRGGEAHAPDAIRLRPWRAAGARKSQAGGRRIAIAVDVLAQQLDFGVARFGQLRALRSTRSRWCGCAPARA